MRPKYEIKQSSVVELLENAKFSIIDRNLCITVTNKHLQRNSLLRILKQRHKELGVHNPKTAFNLKTRSVTFNYHCAIYQYIQDILNSSIQSEEPTFYKYLRLFPTDVYIREFGTNFRTEGEYRNIKKWQQEKPFTPAEKKVFFPQVWENDRYNFASKILKKLSPAEALACEYIIQEMYKPTLMADRITKLTDITDNTAFNIAFEAFRASLNPLDYDQAELITAFSDAERDHLNITSTRTNVPAQETLILNRITMRQEILATTPPNSPARTVQDKKLSDLQEELAEFNSEKIKNEREKYVADIRRNYALPTLRELKEPSKKLKGIVRFLYYRIYDSSAHIHALYLKDPQYRNFPQIAGTYGLKKRNINTNDLTLTFNTVLATPKERDIVKTYQYLSFGNTPLKTIAARDENPGLGFTLITSCSVTIRAKHRSRLESIVAQLDMFEDAAVYNGKSVTIYNHDALNFVLAIPVPDEYAGTIEDENNFHHNVMLSLGRRLIEDSSYAHPNSRIAKKGLAQDIRPRAFFGTARTTNYRKYIAGVNYRKASNGASETRRLAILQSVNVEELEQNATQLKNLAILIPQCYIPERQVLRKIYPNYKGRRLQSGEKLIRGKRMKLPEKFQRMRLDSLDHKLMANVYLVTREDINTFIDRNPELEFISPGESIVLPEKTKPKVFKAYIEPEARSMKDLTELLQVNSGRGASIGPVTKSEIKLAQDYFSSLGCKSYVIVFNSSTVKEYRTFFVKVGKKYLDKLPEPPAHKPLPPRIEPEEKYERSEEFYMFRTLIRNHKHKSVVSASTYRGKKVKIC
jgi:hypothetical protein